MIMTTDFLPLISVIVPVYHAERYLDRCIKSILSQAEANIELWLIDDGSPDQCGNMCDTFAQKDSRVHVIHKKNAGVSSARNDGIKRALGKYIAFVDADDYIEPNMLSLLLSLAERTRADIAICGYYIEKGHMQKPMNLCCDDGDYNKTDVEQLLFKFFGRDCTGLASMCNKLYLRSFLNRQNIQVDESLQRAEDFWFNFEAIKHSTHISVISTPLYHYTQNEESVMHSFRETQFEDWTRNRKRLLSAANECGIPLQLSDFYYNYVYNSVLFLREVFRRSDRKKFYEIVEDSFLRQAIKQTSGLPLHVKVIAFCIEKRFFCLVKLFLRGCTIVK